MVAIGGDPCSFCLSAKHTRTVRPDSMNPAVSVALCIDCCATLLQLELSMLSGSQVREWMYCVVSGELPHLDFKRKNA